MTVPEARKVALQHYGYSADAKRKPANVEVNVYRSFGTGGWDTAPDGGRPAALARLGKLVEDNWEEQVGTLSRTARLSLPQLRCYADMAYGVMTHKDAEAEGEAGGVGHGSGSGNTGAANGPVGSLEPVAGAAPEELLEPWLKALCDESVDRYLVELAGKEGRNLLLVNLGVTG